MGGGGRYWAPTNYSLRVQGKKIFTLINGFFPVFGTFQDKIWMEIYENLEKNWLFCTFLMIFEQK